jgi:outer membrane protein OmpA-like peptidoglycan-associated protein
MKTGLITLIAVGLSVAQSAFALNSTPYSDRSLSSVGDVDRVEYLPTITWGGELQTTFANGNADETAKGSIFDSHGLNLTLKRQDIFQEQVNSYLKGETPFLRGTLGMILTAVEKLNQDPRTAPVIVYKLTNSRGGDALVTIPEIKTINDLINGSRRYKVGVQLDGPHTHFMAKLIKDAGGNMNDIDIVWFKDLTGTEDTAIAAFERGDVDAAFAIIPDALASTGGDGSGCNLGECSIKGAHIPISTKSADTVIMDVYAVRSDYFNAHREEIRLFTLGMLQSNEKVQEMFAKSDSKAFKTSFDKTIRYAGSHLLDFADAKEDIKGLYADAKHVGYPGQIVFFGDKQPRSFTNVANQIQEYYVEMGLISKVFPVQQAFWDYNKLTTGLVNTSNVVVPKFNPAVVAKIVQQKAAAGTLNADSAMSFPVFFTTGQTEFSQAQYASEFDKALEWAATYSSAIITIEGHADPTAFLVAKYKKKQPVVVTDRIAQSAKNLTVKRADKLRKALIKYADDKGIYLDESQVQLLGMGISSPINGTFSNTNRCNAGFSVGDPCAPKNAQQKAEERRVVFQVVPIEAETDAFVAF